MASGGINRRARKSYAEEISHKKGNMKIVGEILPSYRHLPCQGPMGTRVKLAPVQRKRGKKKTLIYMKSRLTDGGGKICKRGQIS